MGSNFAIIYATIVLAYLEEKMYEQSEKEFDLDFRKYIETNFERFLDDCFFIFIRTEQQLMKFFNLLNSHHPEKNTLDNSRTRLPFSVHYSLRKTGSFNQTFIISLSIQNSTFYTHHATRKIYASI